MAIAPTLWILPRICTAATWRRSSRPGSAAGRHRAASRICLWLAASLSLVAPAAQPATDPLLPGKVVRVVDGDTLDVLLASGRIRVRLQGIDAPERDQQGGAAASLWLAQQLLDQPVQLEPVSQDQYQRMVAVVHAGDRDINRELVRSGHAWAYRRYLRRSERDLCSLEYQARREGAGVWGAAAPRAPWEFRATGGKGPFTDFTRSTAGDCRRAMRQP